MLALVGRNSALFRPRLRRGLHPLHSFLLSPPAPLTRKGYAASAERQSRWRLRSRWAPAGTPGCGFPPQRGPSACLGRLPSTHSLAAEKANTPPSLRRTLWKISTRPLSLARHALAASESRSATVASIFSPPAKIPSSPTRPTRSSSIKRRSCVRRKRQTNP